MRGRLGLCIALAGALMIAGGGATGGCARKTPEQRAQDRAQKQAIAQARAQRKAAERQAKIDAATEKQRRAEERRRAEAQAKVERKRAAEQAKADRERAAAEAKRAAAQARIDRQRAQAQARAEAKRAAAQAKADRERAAAEAKRRAAEEKRHAEVMKSIDEPWVIGDPYIQPENRPRLFDRHMQTMAAAGAADEAMLFEQHFDGAQLNALGRSKVALMLQAAAASTEGEQPLTIYVAPADAEQRTDARLAAVNEYVKASPWSAVAVQTRAGLNPQTLTPASVGLAGLRKMEQEQANRGAGGAGGAAAGGSTMNPAGGTTVGGR